MKYKFPYLFIRTGNGDQSLVVGNDGYYYFYFFDWDEEQYVFLAKELLDKRKRAGNI